MISEIKKRKMSITEIIVASFILFKQNFKTYRNIAIFIGIPVNIIITIVANSGITAAGFMNFALAIMSGNQDITELQWTNFVAYYISFLVVQAVCLPLVTMGVARFTKSCIDSEPYTAKEATLSAFGKGSILIFAALIREIILLCSATLVFPWLFFIVYFNFFAIAIVLDNKGVIGSLKASANVVKGNFFGMAFAILFIFMMEFSINNSIQWLFTIVPFNPFVEFLERLIMTVVGVVFQIATTILYLNRKYQKEGLYNRVVD